MTSQGRQEKETFSISFCPLSEYGLYSDFLKKMCCPVVKALAFAVAIFSTASFDAGTIDPTTITLASAPVRLKGKGTPMAAIEDVNNNFQCLIITCDFFDM